MRLFLNGLAASAGGGITYLRNVIPHLARRSDVETTVLLSPEVRRASSEFPNISYEETETNSSTLIRFVREQTSLPGLIRHCGAQVLISTGNFALLNSPVPQILLSRNALYTSTDFHNDLRARRDYSIRADTLIKGWFARYSIRRADITVAPSEAFAQDLTRWSGKKVVCLHHGFDWERFTSDPTPLPQTVQKQFEDANDSLRLLFVSHYNYYRNFETLFRALPILSDRLHRKVKLFLTCVLDSGKNPGSYRTEAASSRVDGLRSSESIVELGTIPYRSLHHLYRACHIYVTPAYAESFAHPLIEAMSCGLPVVASDLPVHREICRDAAVYFPRFSPESLADQIEQVQGSPELAETLSHHGLRRAREFSWSEHVDRLIGLAQGLLQP